MTSAAPEPVAPDPAAPEPAARDEPDLSTQRASALFGALLLVAGVIVIIDASRLRDTAAAIGPNVVPTVVGLLLGAVGAGLLVQSRSALRRSSTSPSTAAPPQESTGRLGVVILVVTLLAFAVLLPVLGYVVSSTALFVVAALLLGAPRRWTVLAYGWALSALVFLVFDRLIGLSLPTGPWGF